jgi:hypothetical protein
VKKLISLFVLFAALLFVAPVQHIVAQKLTVQAAQDPQSTTDRVLIQPENFQREPRRTNAMPLKRSLSRLVIECLKSAARNNLNARKLWLTP